MQNCNSSHRKPTSEDAQYLGAAEVITRVVSVTPARWQSTGNNLGDWCDANPSKEARRH